MRVKILIIFYCAILAHENSFSQNKEVTKEFYSWGGWGASSDNQINVLKKKKRIHSLAIYSYSDTVFPNEFILQFHELKYLFIGGHPKEKRNLQFDSTQLALLKGLVGLQVSDFAIGKFPSSLTVLDSLNFLQIDFCDLEAVPNDIHKFKNLKYLSFAGNKLAYLTDSLSALEQLKTIDLSNNNFIELPKVLVDLPDIKEIYLNNRYGFSKEGFNQNEIDYKKGFNNLFRLSLKRSVKYIFLETRDCDETKFIKQSIKHDMEKKCFNNHFRKSPLEKVSMTTKTRKLCLNFPYIF